MHKLERRLVMLESMRSDYRPARELSDKELLERLGWTGPVPPTDDELLAMIATKQQAQGDGNAQS